MWHEARKHEKKLRGLMVDFRKRAERRREFYEKIRKDPASFLQIHGQQLKVHIDANISQAAESSLMPWQGNRENLIDRFDVRAHLDTIQELCDNSNSNPIGVNDAERQINYERYRNLVQNEFLGLSESKYLHQIWIEERFGGNHNQHNQQQQKNVKKKLAERKATIAYNYNEDDASSLTVNPVKSNESSESEESSDDDIDFDTSVNVDQLTSEMGHRINSIANKFGMKNDDFLRFLYDDKTEAEKIKLAKELDNEKSMFTGRKSRRDRRALKEQRMLILRTANPNDNEKIMYKTDTNDVQSSSESEHSIDETKIEFITSFGGSSEDESKKEKSEMKKEKLKDNSTKRKQKVKQLIHKSEETPLIYGPTLPGEDLVQSHHQSASFNQFKGHNSRMRKYRYNHRSSSDSNRSRSRSVSRDARYSRYRTSYNRYKRFERSRSRSRTRQRRDTRSRSRSDSRFRYNRRGRKSRSISNERRRRRSRSGSKSKGRTSRDTHNRRDNRSPNRSRNRNVRSRSKSRTDHKATNSKKSPPKDEKQRPSAIQSKNDKPKDVEIVQTQKEIIASIPTEQSNAMPIDLPSPPIKRYYRHDLLRDSDSDNNTNDNETDTKTKNLIEEYKKSSSLITNISGNNKDMTALHERLKKKRQQQIEKQYKRDKKAERDRREKIYQERVDREEELREMSNKLRWTRHNRSRTSSRSSSKSSVSSSSS